MDFICGGLADDISGETLIIKLDFRSLRATKWSEYATRFLFGGAVTLLAGLIADKYGPVIGGLFLAFPAIFPATASLLEKHQIEERRCVGLNGDKRGRLVAGVDAAGTAMGCFGLIAFAVTAWKLLPQLVLWQSLTLGTAFWAIIATSVWVVHRKLS